MTKGQMSEADLKRAVSDYLEYKTNLGELYADRLNAGEVIVNYGASGRRRIKLCREGTSDFFVIRKWYPVGAPNKWETLITFLELKSAKGKTSPAQDAFKLLVEKQGASYFLIKSIEELEAILK